MAIGQSTHPITNISRSPVTKQRRSTRGICLAGMTECGCAHSAPSRRWRPGVCSAACSFYCSNVEDPSKSLTVASRSSRSIPRARWSVSVSVDFGTGIKRGANDLQDLNQRPRCVGCSNASGITRRILGVVWDCDGEAVGKCKSEFPDRDRELNDGATRPSFALMRC
jgi:hypothetical protein